MTVVYCREQEFRREAARHGADTFVEEHNPTNVIPFRMLALRDGVPGPIATYANGGTEDGWLWSDAEPLLYLDETSEDYAYDPANDLGALMWNALAGVLIVVLFVAVVGLMIALA